jgi:hypothetical protein
MHTRILDNKDFAVNINNNATHSHIFNPTRNENSNNVMLQNTIHGFPMGNNMTRQDYLNGGVDVENDIIFGQGRNIKLQPKQYVDVDTYNHTTNEKERYNLLRETDYTTQHVFSMRYPESHITRTSMNVNNDVYPIGGNPSRIHEKNRGEKYFTL